MRIAICATVGCFCPTGGPAPAADSAPADAPTRAAIESVLRKGHLEVWFPRCLDRERGGFLCDFDRDWNPAGDQPKTVVFQSRMTWLAARAAARYPGDPRYLEAARHGFVFSDAVQRDRDLGGWYWKLDRAGVPSSEWRDVKHAYGIAFGIFTCAAYHHVTRDAAALDAARDGFDWIERHGHDAARGGYHEFFTRDGTPVVDRASNPLGGDRDCIGTPVGYRSMNTHIHLLEAYTALLAERPDPVVKARTEELIALVRNR